MATFHTCDRCGADCAGAIDVKIEVTVSDWPKADGSVAPWPIVMTAFVAQPAIDFEKPDLCADCFAYLLRETATILTSRQSGPEVLL